MDAAAYPMHKAAWEGNKAQLRKLLNKHPEKANELDAHGNTPLHLAINRQHEAIVKLLLAHPGIDLHQTSKAGWSLMSEALAAGHAEVLTHLHKAQLKAWTKNFEANVKQASDVLLAMPDFSMDVAWELSSWVPFLNKFQLLPSDTYKVWKKGAAIRLDSSLVGVGGHNVQRGRLSLLFFGDGNEERKIPRGALYIVDHDKEAYELVWDHVPAQVEVHTDREVDGLLRTTDLIWSGAPSDFQLNPVLNWRNMPKEVSVAGYMCRLHSVDNLSYTLISRTTRNNRTKAGLVNHSQDDDLDKEWTDYCATEDSAGALLYKKESLREVKKSFSATLALSEKFPRKSKELLAVLRLLFASNSNVAYWTRILEEKLPDGAIPLKIEIPIFPTVSINAALVRYKEENVVEARFDLPSAYKYCSNATERK